MILIPRARLGYEIHFENDDVVNAEDQNYLNMKKKIQVCSVFKPNQEENRTNVLPANSPEK